jgi:hypothetical protein
MAGVKQQARGRELSTAWAAQAVNVQRPVSDVATRAKLPRMGKVFERVDHRLRSWIEKQALFFVGTAPSGKKGHVNVSPKGPIGSLRVVDPATVAYLDVIGSGTETIAHLRQNGRIVVMLCAFAGPPRILRMHGRGEVVLPHEARFAELVTRCRFDDAGVPEARRAVIVVHLHRIADSCGYGVPRMSYEGLRPQMTAWGKKKLRAKDVDALAEYKRAKNATSIDGLPALDAGPPRPSVGRRGR